MGTRRKEAGAVHQNTHTHARTVGRCAGLRRALPPCPTAFNTYFLTSLCFRSVTKQSMILPSQGAPRRYRVRGNKTNKAKFMVSSKAGQASQASKAKQAKQNRPSKAKQSETKPSKAAKQQSSKAKQSQAKQSQLRPLGPVSAAEGGPGEAFPQAPQNQGGGHPARILTRAPPSHAAVRSAVKLRPCLKMLRGSDVVLGKLC